MVKKIRIVSTREGQQGTEASTGQSHQQQCLPKKVRGPTKKKEIWNLENHEKVLVTFDETWQPIGDEGNELTSFLGTLMRMSQHVGIHYLDWRKVPKHKKDDLWSIVKEKFCFDPPESKQIKDWIMSDMSTKWKSWKYDLKKSSYDPSLTINEIVALQTDNRVDKDQFKDLVASWFTEEKQVEATKKKKVRLKSIEPHVTGTKSFARLIHEETIKNSGIRPSRGNVYCMSRTRKDGSIVNAKAAEIVEKLKNFTNESGSSTSQGTVGSFDWTNDDLSKVKGPESGGRVRCVGKVSFAKEKRIQDPQVPILKEQVKDLKNFCVKLVAAISEQIPNLDLSSVIGDVHMEQADDACSVHDNNLNKIPKSTEASHHNSYRK